MTTTAAINGSSITTPLSPLEAAQAAAGPDFIAMEDEDFEIVLMPKNLPLGWSGPGMNDVVIDIPGLLSSAETEDGKRKPQRAWWNLETKGATAAIASGLQTVFVLTGDNDEVVVVEPGPVEPSKPHVVRRKRKPGQKQGDIVYLEDGVTPKTTGGGNPQVRYNGFVTLQGIRYQFTARITKVEGRLNEGGEQLYDVAIKLTKFGLKPRTREPLDIAIEGTGLRFG